MLTTEENDPACTRKEKPQIIVTSVFAVLKGTLRDKMIFCVFVNYNFTLNVTRCLVSKKTCEKKMQVATPSPDSRTKHCDARKFAGVY